MYFSTFILQNLARRRVRTALTVERGMALLPGPGDTDFGDARGDERTGD